jgi:UDP-sulfoquinovose synthase
MHLSTGDHEVGVVDNFTRRAYDTELGSDSLVPIEPLERRVAVWRKITGQTMTVYEGDITDFAFTRAMFAEFRPDAVVHFAEQRSAPYSMIDQAHAVYTQVNNVTGTLNVLYAIAELDPDIHLVKLGTMGEYGTPNIDIEEGWLEVMHHGRTDRVLYPKRPGSFYHLSKVHDSHNIEFACRTWNLRATDLNQGIVYGQHTDEIRLDRRLATRFDYDAVFGTVLNRMIVQAVCDYPLTVYGGGQQVRAMLDIRDTVECIGLAVEHPAARGEFRVFNQFTEEFPVAEIASRIVSAHPGSTIAVIENPRVEASQHHYHAAHQHLLDLGLSPHLLDRDVIESLLDLADQYRHRARPALFAPTVRWRSTSNPTSIDDRRQRPAA